MQNTNLSFMVLGSSDSEENHEIMMELSEDQEQLSRTLMLSPEKKAFFTDEDGRFLDGESICGRFIMTSCSLEDVQKSPQMKKLKEIEKMRDYVYFGDGSMIPVSKETALKVCKQIPVYCLYEDDEEEMVIPLKNPNFIDVVVLAEHYEEAKEKITDWAGREGFLGVKKEDVSLLWDQFCSHLELGSFELAFDWLDYKAGIFVGDIEKWFVHAFGCATDAILGDSYFPF